MSYTVESEQQAEAELNEQFTYHAPTAPEVARMTEIREAAKNLASIIRATVPPCADRSAAIRKIREASMTANAAIVLNRAAGPAPSEETP
jgi:hypothetical protein